MTLTTAPLKEATFKIGLGLWSIAAIGLLLLIWYGDGFLSSDKDATLFFGIFIMFWLFLVVVMVRNKQQYGRIWRFRDRHNNIALLQLANLSAYALNQSLPLFAESTTWLTYYLIWYHAILWLWCFRESDQPDSFNYTAVLTVGTGIVFHLYQTLYLIPIYPFSAFLFWFFGIPLVAFVPLWHLFMAIGIGRQYIRSDRSYASVLAAGALVPLVLIGVYSWQWREINKGLEEAVGEQNRPLHEGLLPVWVDLAQDMPDGPIAVRTLKGEWSYQIINKLHYNSLFSGRINETIRHDPLVAIASFLNEPLEITENDRIHLLNSVHNQRHFSEPKLWRGDRIITDSVTTEVQLFPEYRMAYTEKTIVIRQPSHQERWRGDQEALFTFHLPEGAVTSSASLWIEGHESPALLTTKSKADSAYTAIVGREQRDPLLVHWREGNRVTARIFPVPNGGSRKFKIGFTSPLQVVDDRLQYPNIDFEGPDWRNAHEEVTIVASGEVGKVSAPLRLREDGNTWHYEGQYRSDWAFSFNAPDFSDEIFSFNDRGIQLMPLRRDTRSFQPTAIYLDINEAWSKREFRRLWPTIADREVYVYTNRLERMTEGNRKRLFRQLRQRRYSLFPFFRIEAPEEALVISRYSGNTPVLSDLGESRFASELNNYLAQTDTRISFFNLDEQLSPYLRTLRDLGLFRYQSGTLEDLRQQLDTGQFLDGLPEGGTMVNYDAGYQLREVAPSTQPSKAPDHLLRLYSYQKILQQTKDNFYDQKILEDSLITLAEEAYITTPISSLIVLETQEDYDRFDIKKSKNSLGNASIKSAGSVPEPHEWLLIGLGLAFMLWVWKGNQRLA